jgi:hypothetical protein
MVFINRAPGILFTLLESQLLIWMMFISYQGWILCITVNDHIVVSCSHEFVVENYTIPHCGTLRCEYPLITKHLTTVN